MHVGTSTEYINNLFYITYVLLSNNNSQSNLHLSSYNSQLFRTQLNNYSYQFKMQLWF